MFLMLISLKTQSKKYLLNFILIDFNKSISLDNEISLALESAPTPDSGDEVYNTPEYFNNDPYKGNLT